MADDFQRLAMHAGTSACILTATKDQGKVYTLEIKDVMAEDPFFYEGDAFTLQFDDSDIDAFYARCNGKPLWMYIEYRKNWLL